MHSSNTFITRLGLYNHVVLVWRLLWREWDVKLYYTIPYHSLAWHCHESLHQPVRINIEIHENMWLIQLTTMLNTVITDAA